MKVTISTHNGWQVAREHNIRNPKVVSKEKHIEMSRPHETWIDEPVREAYKRLFGEAVEEYNAKQKRSDRKILDYYNVIRKDKNKHPVYEMIIGIYGKNPDSSPICSQEKGKEIMRKFVDNWKERNPHLIIIGAYWHADEKGGDHVHIDYIPVADGYKRGMAVQTAMNKALEQQGFSFENAKATPQIKWEQRENEYLTKLCEESGLTVDHPKNGKKHLETGIYKLTKEKEKAEETVKTLTDKVTVLQSEYDKLKKDKAEVETTLKTLSDKVITLQSEYYELKEDKTKAETTIRTLSDKMTMVQAEYDKLKEEHDESIKNLIKGIAPPPIKPKKPRRADWEVWKQNLFPKDENDRPLDDKGKVLRGHRLKKAIEEEKVKYDVYMAEWVEYDKQHSEWYEKAKELKVIEKAVDKSEEDKITQERLTKLLRRQIAEMEENEQKYEEKLKKGIAERTAEQDKEMEKLKAEKKTLQDENEKLEIKNEELIEEIKELNGIDIEPLIFIDNFLPKNP